MNLIQILGYSACSPASMRPISRNRHGHTAGGFRVPESQSGSRLPRELIISGATRGGSLSKPFLLRVNAPHYPGTMRNTVAVSTAGTFHWGYFFPLAWSTAAFSAGSFTTDKSRS
jgi:hypothetical protein